MAQTYTQQDVDDLLSKMALERGKLLAAAEGLNEDDSNRVPVDAVGEEQWTAKEQLAHLWEMERSYIAWCRAGQAESGVDASDIRGEPVEIPIERAPQHSVRELLDALIDERSKTNDYIRSLTLDEFAHTASTPGFGELTLMQWLRSFYRHDRMHTAQIEGRQSDYRPQYQGGTEANQRQMRIDQVAAREQDR
ncbi:MAG: DinB family protein [Chloroflexi bacterium]|nr:DinB family protein [Chloroflexota bacterium]MCY3697310.1 DinB family protein [Chloroflexota bacterium]